MTSEFPVIPPNMRKVYRRLKRWRNAHTGRLPILGPLWAAEVELAREDGIFPTAKVLRLEYGKLKHWVEAADPVARKGRVAKLDLHSGELFPRVGLIVTNLVMDSRAVGPFYNQGGHGEAVDQRRQTGG
ncbi:MAG: hypothetical protein ABSD45_12895 [Terriglobia bacterium]|jgi:hypothetical protein